VVPANDSRNQQAEVGIKREGGTTDGHFTLINGPEVIKDRDKAYSSLKHPFLDVV
jgi:hypothetical protein